MNSILFEESIIREKDQNFILIEIKNVQWTTMLTPLLTEMGEGLIARTTYAGIGFKFGDLKLVNSTMFGIFVNLHTQAMNYNKKVFFILGPDAYDVAFDMNLTSTLDIRVVD